MSLMRGIQALVATVLIFIGLVVAGAVGLLIYMIGMASQFVILGMVFIAGLFYMIWEAFTSKKE